MCTYTDRTWLQLMCYAHSNFWSLYFGQVDRRGWRVQQEGVKECLERILLDNNYFRPRDRYMTDRLLY